MLLNRHDSLTGLVNTFSNGLIKYDCVKLIASSALFVCTGANARQILKDYAATLIVCTFASGLSLMLMLYFSQLEWITTDAVTGLVGFNSMSYTMLVGAAFVFALAFFIGS